MAVRNLFPNPVNSHTRIPTKKIYSWDATLQLKWSLIYFSFFQGFGDYQPIMKYDNLGLDWKDWRDYIDFNRNIEKEKELYYNVD